MVTSMAFSLWFAAFALAAVPIPLAADRPQPPEQLRTTGPAVLDLRGTWRFQLTHGRMTTTGYQPDACAELASSVQPGNPYEAALDGDLGTRWCASDGSLPQWYVVDLGAAEKVTGLGITWEFDEVLYRFAVDASLDLKQWSPLADCRAAPGLGSGPVAIPATVARFLRITVIGVGQGKWASIRELAVTVERDGAPVAWRPPPAAEPDGAELEAFTRLDFDDSLWSDIPVPSNWEIEGFSVPTYWGPDNTVGLYRRWIDVPAAFADQRVLLHFDGVNNGAEVWLNEQRVGYHESGMTAWELDVTEAVRPGKRNLLALRVCKTTPSHDLDTGDYWFLGGIYRETYLLALPPTHIEDITILTDLDDAWRDADLTVQVAVRGIAGATVSVRGRLHDPTGALLETPVLAGEATVDEAGRAVLTLTAPVRDPRLWSAEKPALYTAVLALQQDGRVVERVQERFGFREIAIRDGVLLWNGVPIKCTGTCRHEEWPNLGKALDEAAWRTDFRLLKGCNINSVRTSHYNFAQRFMELSDELGLYVLDEIPFCWCNTKDEALRPAFLQRAVETYERDKNRPSVLAWSLGNENEPGPNIQAVVDYLAQVDPTRPRFASCQPASRFPGTHFDDYHYPSLGHVEAIGRAPERATIPAVITEQPHIFYVPGALDYDYGAKDFWGQALADLWQIVWDRDSVLGCWIWEWQDQSMDDRYPDKSRDYDPQTGLRLVAKKGVVDGYRHPKPEYWHIQMVYSPVHVLDREVAVRNGRATVLVENRYAFTDLSELTVRYQSLAGERVLDRGTATANGAPGAVGAIDLPVHPEADSLRIEFHHPDGRMLSSARLRVAGKPEPTPPPAREFGEPLKVVEAADTITVSNRLGTLVWTKADGALRTWQSSGREILAGGWLLNLGELRPNRGEHGAGNFVQSASPPQLRDVRLTARSRGAAVRVELSGDVYLVESPDRKAVLRLRADVFSNHEMAVAWELQWLAEDVEVWELGWKLPLATEFDRLAWRRNALWSDYPADHIGRPAGVARRDDLAFACTKRDVRWIELGGAGRRLILLPDDGPLHARGLATADAVMLFASAAVAPPRDFSTNLLPGYAIHLRRNSISRGSFRLRVPEP